MLRKILLFLFTRETLYYVKQDLHFIFVRIKNSIRFESNKNIKAKYLNVGCGPHGKKDEMWFNIDGWTGEGIDGVYDIRRGLPFEDGTFSGIFTEHFFEHLEQERAEVFLNECKRILKPGGVLRISVPDGQIYLEKYFSDRDWMLARRNNKFSTPMEVVNEVFRQEYQHKFCYDYETMELYLNNSGFSEVQRVDYGIGRDAILLIDQESRRFESLYVEAYK